MGRGGMSFVSIGLPRVEACHIIRPLEPKCRDDEVLEAVVAWFPGRGMELRAGPRADLRDGNQGLGLQNVSLSLMLAFSAASVRAI